ncbi:MAG: molybdopterin-dependent oxidoreductase, partial [Desulfarculaceae bacterium]
GVPIEDITIVAHDTDICPWDVGTHASRQAFISGNAAIQCAKELRRKIFELAAEQMGVDPKDLDMKMGRISVRGKDAKTEPMALAKVLRRAHFSSQGKMVIAETFYDPPNEMLGKDMKGNISCSYAFGAHGVEVEVDLETGRVQILNYQAAHDVGKALNPMGLEGQIYGAAVMGTGFAMSEEVKLKDGDVINGAFHDYMLLTAKDELPVTPIIVETDDPAGPYGAKGIGEPGCVPSAPTIANAIFDAVGVRLCDLPMTPEKLLRALKEKEKA